MPPRTPRSTSSTSSARARGAARRSGGAAQSTAGGRPDWSPAAPKKSTQQFRGGGAGFRDRANGVAADRSAAQRAAAQQPARKAARDARIERLATPAAAQAATAADAPVATTFAALGVPRSVVTALTERGITTPFPIQAATLPDSLAGRDIIGKGRTGSGKTVAFAVPTVTVLSKSGKPLHRTKPRALILVPTRELAAQVAEVFTPLASALGLTTAVVVGGMAYNRQIATLAAGVDVLIATPGRLEDLITQRKCRLDAVEVTVLDEADMMADMGFMPAVQRLLDATPAGQRMLFSATIDRAVDGLVRRYLDRPATHSIAADDEQSGDTDHHVLVVARDQKHAVVEQLAGGQGRALLFTRTKFGAAKLAANLTKAGIPAVELHGDLVQRVRTRNLDAFTSGKVRVLVATDIAARGIHVDDVSLVVHVDPPAEHKAFLHRSGRTARAGADGTVVTVVMHDQRREVAQLMRTAGIRATETDVMSGSREIRELVGPPADYVDPEHTAMLLNPPQQHARRRPQPATARSAQSRTTRSGKPDGGLGARPRRSRQG